MAENFCTACIESSSDESSGDVTSLNGFGSAFFGEKNRCPDCGSVVRTVWFVLMHFPLIPLGSYRVKPVAGTFRKFHSRKLPLDLGQVIWTLLVAFILISAGHAILAWYYWDAYLAQGYGWTPGITVFLVCFLIVVPCVLFVVDKSKALGRFFEWIIRNISYPLFLILPAVCGGIIIMFFKTDLQYATWPEWLRLGIAFLSPVLWFVPGIVVGRRLGARNRSETAIESKAE